MKPPIFCILLALMVGVACAQAPKQPAGPPKPIGSPPADKRSLSIRLLGTKWNWPDDAMDRRQAWFRFDAGGKATAGWHTSPRSWKKISDDTVELQITVTKKTITIQFDPELTVGTNVDKPSEKYTRLAK